MPGSKQDRLRRLSILTISALDVENWATFSRPDNDSVIGHELAGFMTHRPPWQGAASARAMTALVG